jgi:hypothetical protein
MNPIDQIMDENNQDNIILYNEKNEPIEFRQIAVIGLEDELYVILQPIGIDLIGQDEALVFSIEEDEDEETVKLVDDDEIIDRVFEEYYRLLRESGFLPDESEG